MNRTINDFSIAFENTLAEQGFTFQVDPDNIYSISQVDKPDRKVTAKLICSEPINEKLHGTKNDTEIKAIGYFRFKLSPESTEPNFYFFAFNNNQDNKTEFVIIPNEELKNRLSQRKRITDNQKTELILWLMPGGYVFDATNIGAEAEWYFIAGRMAVNTIGDYTIFLNHWGII